MLLGNDQVIREYLHRTLKPDARTKMSRHTWTLTYVVARLQLWLHALKGTWSMVFGDGKKHLEMILSNKEDRILILACTCGRVFWCRGEDDEADRSGDHSESEDGDDRDRPV